MVRKQKEKNNLKEVIKYKRVTLQIEMGIAY